MDAATRRTILALSALALPLLLVTCKGATEANVATTVVIAPGPVTLTSVGATKKFTATVKDQHGNPMPGAHVTWQSSSPAVATVDTTGLATAAKNGTTQVSATSGAATGSIIVTVAQAPAQVTGLGGGQSGTVGQTLALPLVVAVVDSAGHAVAGVAVGFAVTSGGGSVGTSSVASDASGMAQTTWTLGNAAGTQTVTATVAGAAGSPLSFGATAVPGAPATVAVQSGNNQKSGAHTSVPTKPSVIVKDALNNATPGATVTYVVASGGGTITGAVQTTNASGLATVGSWTLGNVGVNTLTATVTGSGITGNPITFTDTAAASGAAANVSMLVGNFQTGLVGYGVNIRPAVLVTDAAGTPVQGQSVTFAAASGGGSVTGASASTSAFGIAQVGSWVLGAAPGTNTLTASVTGVAGSPVTFTATGQAATFGITVQNYGPPFSAAVHTAMDSAAHTWQRIIYQTLGSISIPSGLFPAGTCGTGTPVIVGTYTDLTILAKFDSIDGPGKILGQSSPCIVASDGSRTLTFVGVMQFDTADVATLIAAGSLDRVILHEMGHVLGFGTLWGPPGGVLVANCIQLLSSASLVQDTYFSCPLAQAAFDTLGGTSYTGGNIVPVENCDVAHGAPSNCGAGTANSHWRETTFYNELMTGYLNGGVPNPLSVMTIAAMGDIGLGVNYAAAEPYNRVFSAPAALGGPHFDLGDDILHGPMYVVDRAGRVIGVLRR
jgi:hypothetical protein